MNYTTILFDLDGTLLNTLVDLKNSVNYALEQFGYPLQSLENIRNFVGDGVAMLVHRSVPAGTPADKEASCLAVFKEHYMIHMNDNTCPYDGLLPVIEELRKRGCRIGIGICGVPQSTGYAIDLDPPGSNPLLCLPPGTNPTGGKQLLNADFHGNTTFLVQMRNWDFSPHA